MLPDPTDDFEHDRPTIPYGDPELMTHTYHLHDAIDLASLILQAAEELHGSPEAQAIVAAGRGPELRRLTAAVAARAALAVRSALSMPSPT